jgi:heat shock protein HslJ
MKISLLSILVVVMFARCNAIKPQTSPLNINGPEWKLTAIEHKVIGSDGRAYLQFDGKELEVKGKAFCNTIKADYERMGDDQITFQDIVTTKMYCEGVMALENQMITNLRNVKRFEIRNGMLYLSDSDKILLTFKK